MLAAPTLLACVLIQREMLNFLATAPLGILSLIENSKV
jgi:hypothetical protein